MPRFDGTGPQGQGPRTGGGRGRCGVSTDQSTTNSGIRGVARGGRPRGDGMGRCFGGGHGQNQSMNKG